MTRRTDRAIRIGLLILAAVLLLSTVPHQEKMQFGPNRGRRPLHRTLFPGGRPTAAMINRQGEGGYSLGGTAGQPDAALWSGDGYALAGGFWAGAVVEYLVYLPLVLR